MRTGYLFVFQALRVIKRLESLYLLQVIITIKVLQEAVCDGLIVQGHADIEITRNRIGNRYAIAYFVASQVEVRVIGCLPKDGDI